MEEDSPMFFIQQIPDLENKMHTPTLHPPLGIQPRQHHTKVRQHSQRIIYAIAVALAPCVLDGYLVQIPTRT